MRIKMMTKIMNKLYPGRENYKKRNAVYRKVRSITGGIKCIVKCAFFVSLSIPIIAGIFLTVIKIAN